MKIQALLIAAALATGCAFAAGTATPTTAPVKKIHKQTAKTKQAATQAMGAGPASPLTDLQASSRQARIDQAYTNWQAQAR